LEHQGIRVELLGIIENTVDKSQSTTFVQLTRDLEPAGTLTDNVSYDFAFNRVEKAFETYTGIAIKLRYCIQVVINRPYNRIVQEEEFVVRNAEEEPDFNPPVRMEVGIEACLHIELEFERSKYHLRDCVAGKVHFNLVRVKLKQMELGIVKKETAGSITESETAAKFEIMDGTPVKGESVPVRFYLSSSDLTPTYKNVSNRFSTRYFMNLVLIDEEGRRYFK